ncbi:MAG TPA: polysaccharide deacetylase family protein [Ramlibacter sp.]|jgi:peptidoglycan/xylan/chitin deacetylase (PgdA/CDA1 family)|nr:polysaccharide deacetylase family protein [Ramlibacter sp.]
MKSVTLTFDNGPHAQGTPHLLDVLARRSLKATFMLVGEYLRDPELRTLARRIRDEGHAIGNHTLTHGVPLGKRPGRDVAEREIGETQRLLGDLATGRLFRPNGDKGRLGEHMLSEDAVDYLCANRYTAISWNCVPEDWVMPADAWVARAQETMKTQEWTLLVLHDYCAESAMKHVGPFLDRLIAENYEFSMQFPPECVLIRDGARTPALQGMYTPRGA